MSEDLFRILQVLLGLAGVLLLAAYVYYTYGLFKNGSRQLQELKLSALTARKEFEARTRAWIGIEDIHPEGEDETDLRSWTIEVKNYGWGPAENLTVHLSRELPGLSGSGREAAQMPDAPLIVFPSQCRHFHIGFDEREVAHLQADDGACRVEIEVSYTTAGASEELRQVRTWRPESKAWAIAEAEVRQVSPT